MNIKIEKFTENLEFEKFLKFWQENKYGVALQGANYIKVYHKQNKGSFTIPQKYFNELW